MSVPRGSERNESGSHPSRFRPDFETFIKRKRQQLNSRRQRGGRFPRNRGFSSRRPNRGGPFNKGTRFPFKARSRSPNRNKFYTRRSRSRSPNVNKYSSRKSRSPSSDKCNFSTSRTDSRGEGSFNKLNNLQVERSCSPIESLRITIDNDCCESVNLPILQTDYTMSENWSNRRSSRNEDSSRRSGSGSNYSNSPDNRNRNIKKEVPAASIFTQKHLSSRDMHNFDDDVHAGAITTKAIPKSPHITASSSSFNRNENKVAPAQSIFTRKHLSGRDMHNFDDDVHASAIAAKAIPKPVSITSSSFGGDDENKRRNVDDNLNSRHRKRPFEAESFASTSSSSNRELETIAAIIEGPNYNASSFTAPWEEKPLFYCQDVKPSRVKGTLNVGIIPPKKIKAEIVKPFIPGLDLDPDDVDEYLYGDEESNDSQSKSSTPNTSTNVVVETMPSRVSALDPRLRKGSAPCASVSDLNQAVLIPPIQKTASALYHPFEIPGPPAHYYHNTVQASTSAMELQLPLPTFGVMNMSRHTNSFNVNNLKQIPITTQSEILALQNDQNANNGGGNTVSSQAHSTDSSWVGESKIKSQEDKENVEYQIQSYQNKLDKCEDKLKELKQKQLELITQTKRRKDGVIDQKYTNNCNSQDEVNKKIREFKSKLELFRKRVNEYDREKSYQQAIKPIHIKKPSTDKVSSLRSKSTSRNESPVEKPKSSQVAFQYVDYRNHFCTHCQEIIPSINEFLRHLHSKHIDVVNNMQESDRPWSVKSSDNKIQNATKVYPAPVKGVEFMLPCTGFYCKLCKELFGDSASAKVHLESYNHNKNQAKFCKENTHYQTKITLQRNAKLNADSKRGLSVEKVVVAPDQIKNDNDVKQAASSKSLSTKIINKEVLVANKISENIPVENEGSHTITKPGAKIPIKLKDKGVSNNVILAEAATKAEELKVIKQAESEALKTSSSKCSFKPMQFKKPLSRGPPPPLEEFITIGQSSYTLPEELVSPPPLKLQPNIKPNLPFKIKPEPQDAGYDKYMNSNVGAQKKDEVANLTAIQSPQSPILSSANIDNDSIIPNTENVKSESEEGNGLNIKIVSVQSLISENGAQNLFDATESANRQENEECDPEHTDDNMWNSETIPDEDRMELDEDLRYHENDQAINLTSNEMRIKIEDFTTDDTEKLWR